MVVSGIAMPIAIFIAPFNVAGLSKLDVFPGGGASAGVGATLLVIVAILWAVIWLRDTFTEKDIRRGCDWHPIGHRSIVVFLRAWVVRKGNDGGFAHCLTY